MINSKAKGKRGERLWRDQLREAGYVDSVRDGQQGAGVNGNLYHPDVISPELPLAHWEVKAQQNLNVRKALEQAIGDAGDRVPIVASKTNAKPWIVTLLADDFFQLVHSGSLYLK